MPKLPERFKRLRPEFFTAVGKGDVKQVAKLLKQEPSLLEAPRPAAGWRAMHLAADRGHTGVGELLHSKGADLNSRTGAGATPLSIAAEAGHKDFVEFLLGKGADPSIADMCNLLPMQIAAQQGHTEISSLLARHATARRGKRKK